MRILIDSGTTNCRNLGDVAVLQAAVERLRAFDRDVTLHAFTADATELQRQCPGVKPVDELARRAWIAAEFGREDDTLAAPGRPVDRVRHMLRRLRPRRRAPAGVHQTPATVAAQMAETDLFVVCGQATLADADRAHAMRLLRTASVAVRQGIPVAFFSQGIGPLTDPAVLDLARAVLGAAVVVGIREQRVAQPLLDELGVPADRIFLTGDDAIEAAYGARPAVRGNGLGVHLRIAPLAASPEIIQQVRPVLHQAARARGAPMIPLPISHHHHGGAYDPATIRALLEGYDDASDGGVATDTPAKVTAAAGSCRVVVTGAYHAAVFALAQGVPAICLGQSAYYLKKFHGLVDGFGAGCQVVRLDDPELAVRLRQAIEIAWDGADTLSAPLLQAAERQIAAARTAYGMLARRLKAHPAAAAHAVAGGAADPSLAGIGRGDGS